MSFFLNSEVHSSHQVLPGKTTSLIFAVNHKVHGLVISVINFGEEGWCFEAGGKSQPV